MLAVCSIPVGRETRFAVPDTHTLPFTPQTGIEEHSNAIERGDRFAFSCKLVGWSVVHGLQGPHKLLTLFLGDISNLLGCILTHQLPFQVSIL